MKRVMLMLVAATVLAIAQPALARDPFREDPEPAPAAWTPDPAPVYPPAGIYLVTDTYAGDSVTRSGPLTTYSTETIHETTGSYARVLETVGTGGSSAYDGAAFNGRAALTDGRAVAGTYYENYVWTEAGFVAVSVVFFQDDSEIARQGTVRRPRPTAAPPRSSPPVSPPPATVTLPVGPPTDGAPAPGSASPAPLPRSTLLPDRAIEVLRGRRTSVSFLSDDVRSWRLLSGPAVPLGPVTGSAAEPFVARWDELAPPAGAWVVRFQVAYADGTTHERVLRVSVRSPGLVE